MRARRGMVIVLCLATIDLRAPIAIAAPPKSPPADDLPTELKHRGDDAMDSLQYDEAIADYSKAYEISQDPVLLYNRGRVYQARDQYPEALADIERFQNEASPDLLKRVPLLAELVADLRSKVTTLTITSSVSGARVLVRTKQVGVTPLTAPLRVNSGPATIEVIADGYEPFKRDIDLPGQANINVDAPLVTKNKTGVLIVKTSITSGSASIAIDGKMLGNAPVEATLNAGTHAIIATSDGYKDAQTTVIVNVGERRDVTIPLEHKPPIVAKWWFWTGAAVVVVGGIVLTYALLSEKSQPQGDQFTPGQVRGPLTF